MPSRTSVLSKVTYWCRVRLLSPHCHATSEQTRSMLPQFAWRTGPRPSLNPDMTPAHLAATFAPTGCRDQLRCLQMPGAMQMSPTIMHAGGPGGLQWADALRGAQRPGQAAQQDRAWRVRQARLPGAFHHKVPFAANALGAVLNLLALDGQSHAGMRREHAKDQHAWPKHC